jgi:hypothetical protein
MTTDKKLPLHKHTHPAYSWIALMVTVTIILVVAGWYYLTYQDGLNEEVITSIKTSQNTEVSSNSTETPVDIDKEIFEIQEEIDAVSDTDFSDAQLDDTILGIQ